MKLIWNQPALRLFYLATGPTPRPPIFASKAAGPFVPPVNQLQFIGAGWWALTLTPADTSTLGPLAWSIPIATALSLPCDQVTALEHGTINPDALQGAFVDLARGFSPNLELADLLRRPLFQFLLSLQ